tara:strand:+ start:1360 stop:1485 length:126 start_codon:yes stop_codon:yes gene_type:complete
MLELKNKYKGKIIHCLNDLDIEFIEALKVHSDFILKYFIEK